MGLIEARNEGAATAEGVIVVKTGAHTGRSPNDRFIVRTNDVADSIWWGDVNRPISLEHFDRLYQRLAAYFTGREIFVQDALAGAHPDHALPVRVITTTAWLSLFARNMFIRLNADELAEFVPAFTVLHAPEFAANPEEEGTNSGAFIIINFERKAVIIGGTAYAGEIKKSIFSVLNYRLPAAGVLPMHCSANVNDAGEVALFFGLSGTGKTTLSSDLNRKLIGDDEHGWGDDGVFNFEGGCYAKTIRLREEYEPLIYRAASRPGAILENVVLDTKSGAVDFDDGSITENTRVSYPLEFIENALPGSRAGHPANIFFLTADAFGVFPPIARLTPEQAMYYFLSGYTSKTAGTEKGLGIEPQTTFSACFGAPFLPLHPRVYAEMLGEKLKQHKAQVWLVNTGWTGGPYGVGERMHLPYTRAMVSAAMAGQLDGVEFRADPHFGLRVPQTCPAVPSEVLNPRGTWKDTEAYDKQAVGLIARFKENFKQYENEVSKEVAAAGPQ
jgi:phosphoenolpyruvate carboxykinase (ATP)